MISSDSGKMWIIRPLPHRTAGSGYGRLKTENISKANLSIDITIMIFYLATTRVNIGKKSILGVKS